MLKRLFTAALTVSGLALAVTSADAASYGMSAPPASHMQAAPAMAKGGPMMMMAPAHRMRTAKGRVLVDSRGFALYTFAKDSPSMSACMLGCAVAWPPFYAPMGAQASGRWTIIRRGFGFTGQWAYNGHPLYFWFKDTRPGEVTGDNVDGFHVAR